MIWCGKDAGKLEILAKKISNRSSNILIVVHGVKTLHSSVNIRCALLLRANTHAESHSGPSSVVINLGSWCRDRDSLELED